MAIRRAIEPTTEPISVEQAKAHMRVTGSGDDTLIEAMIKAVRAEAENKLVRSLVTQTWQKTLDYFPTAIELPYPPVVSVTSIEYIDTAGTLQALDSAAYAADTASEPGWVVPAYGYDWPDTRDQINAVVVTYVAGYGAAEAVPVAIQNWMLLHVAHLYENREATTPGRLETLPFIEGLLDPFRMVMV